MNVRRKCTWLVNAALLLVAAGTSWSEDAPPQRPGEASESAIRALVLDLDADDYERRQEATKQLAKLGEAAIGPLTAALGHRSEEVRFRARVLLHSLREGPLVRDMAAYAARPTSDLDVEEGMWLIARIFDPKADRQKIDHQLDALAERVRKHLGEGVAPSRADPAKVVEAIRHVVFAEEGLSGNKEEYHHPDNSSLPRVLETKKGLPILLGHVVVSVAERLDVPIVGVPVSPYLIKYDGSRAPEGFERRDIYLDPFEAGAILAHDDPRIENLPPLTGRRVVVRMLANLVTALGDKKDERLEKVVEFRSLLEGEDGQEASLAPIVEVFDGPFIVPLGD